MGAVLHTLNIRLFPEQLAYVINHAGDKVIIVDGSLVPLLAKVRGELTTVETIIVRGEGDRDLLGETLDYDELLGAQEPGFEWPDLDERAAAAMCYTSGTTGNPKGVVYSHRSTWLHSVANTVGQHARVLRARPLPARRADVPRERLGGALHLVPRGRPSWSCPSTSSRARPCSRSSRHPSRRSRSACRRSGTTCCTRRSPSPPTCPRCGPCSRAARPCRASLIESFRDRFGVTMVQGWGMTEMSPLGTVAIPPADTPADERVDYLVKAGRVVAGVEIRICDDDGLELPKDGEAVGEIEVRGPWITGAYYASDDPEKFHDGWLRTGDVGALDRHRVPHRVGPHEGRDQVGRRVDQLGRARERGHGPPRRLRGRGRRDPRRAVARATARVRRRHARRGHPRRPAELVSFLEPRVAKWWLPDQWVVHRRDPEDLGRQVRQEGPARPVRQGRARRRHPRPPPAVSGDEALASLADEIDAIAERLADRSLELLREAVGDPGSSDAATTERVVTRARRSLEKASSLLRGLGAER